MCAYISEMALIYDDRKIMFVYKFLSDEASLKSAFQDKTAEFYSALNTKLIIMDDEDFRNDQLFTEGEWKNIIQASITKAFELTKKLIAAPPNN
jgi:hypothetical protein